MTEISYHHVEDFPGWEKAPDFLGGLIAEYQPKCLLEIGSGANPTLDEVTARQRELRYITSDCEPEELAKAPAGMETRVLKLDSEHPPGDLVGRCDMVFSRMVNEHVRDGATYHKNIRELLSPAGVAVHCFSTLYSGPMIANALLPGGASQKVLDFLTGRHHHSKFSAHYSWSRGPTKGMVKRFEDIGYRVIAYRGYFGHWYYWRLKPLHHLEFWKAQALLKLPNPLLCSYAMVVLRKAAGGRHDVSRVAEPSPAAAESSPVKERARSEGRHPLHELMAGVRGWGRRS